MTEPTDDRVAQDEPVNSPERATEHPDEPGAYIGREAERAADTIPGGVRHDDERISAGATQSSGVGRPDERGQRIEPPSGHREVSSTDDDRREAGQNA